MFLLLLFISRNPFHLDDPCIAIMHCGTFNYVLHYVFHLCLCYVSRMKAPIYVPQKNYRHCFDRPNVTIHGDWLNTLIILMSGLYVGLIFTNRTI